MGCCSSKSKSSPEGCRGPHRDCKVYGSQKCGEARVQIGISVAGLLHSLPLDKLSVVGFEEGYTLAALSNVHGRREAAEYCSSRLQQVFRTQLAAADGDIVCALTQTLRQLDSDFLNCQKYPAVRATSGASVSVACLDARTQRLHLASVGGCNVIQGELLHGLAKQVAEAAFLFPPVEPAPLLGMGKLRDPHLAGVYNHGVSSPEERVPLWEGPRRELAVSVVTRQLLPVHESVIIGGPGFWSLASPAATALRAHFYLRANAGVHAPGLAQQLGAPDAPVPATADHLVRFAEQHALERLRKPADADVTALVLTLKWPANSINQAFAEAGALERLQASAEREALPSERAQRHWRLIRTLCIEYSRAHRRMVQQKWQRTVRQALEQGVKRARKLEEELWKSERLVVHISPSMKVRNQRGQEIKLRPRHLECAAFA